MYKFEDPSYDFLKTNKHLGSNIIVLGLGGSHAYGTNTESSDVDIRGIATNSASEILLGNGFEQVTDNATDTVVYSFNKIISLLTNCNPNCIEILGLKPEHYFILTDIGKQLIDNADMFISQKCVRSFGGYASQQLYRLQHVLTHSMQQTQLEEHILKTLKSMQLDFVEKYKQLDGYMKLYIDKSEREDYDTEIYMDVHLSHYPVRDYIGMWSELQSTTKSYNKLGKRNEHALDHAKLAKHSMHLVRLYHMAIDLLEGRGIITYRESDHDELMDIRNGKYIKEDNNIDPLFFDMVDELERKFNEAKKNTSIPKNPDIKRINAFVEDVNGKIVNRGAA